MTPTTPASTERSDGNDGAAGGQTTEFENHTEIEFEGPTEMGEMTDGARDRSAHRVADIDRLTACAGQRGGPPAMPAASDGVSGGGKTVTAGSNAR